MIFVLNFCVEKLRTPTKWAQFFYFFNLIENLGKKLLKNFLIAKQKGEKILLSKEKCCEYLCKFVSGDFKNKKKCYYY